MAESPEGQSLVQWGQSKEWRRLLHYQVTSWGSDRSEVDGSGFFLSADGKYDPIDELRKTIEAMRDPKRKIGKFKLHPQCAFPVRFLFLKNQMGLSFAHQASCERLDKFMVEFHDPESVSVIFSSAYPNNPASMFGHTFLKFNSSKASDLKHVGINFAASVPPDENPVAFAYFGVAGGYRGAWSTTSFHAKIKEYNQSENRDLWEYILSLNPEETKRLILHIWELETNGDFEYYFFDENCAYQILRAIEAIKPEWTLSDHTIYLIPGDSIKGLSHQPGAIQEIRYRPSVQRKLMFRYKNLTSEQKVHFFDIIELKPFPEKADMATLDAAIEYFQFLDIKLGGELKPEQRTRQLQVLSKRSKMGPGKDLVIQDAETQPEKGHDSYSAFFSQTFRDASSPSRRGGATQVKIKSAYHDLMNRDLGFTRYSHIDMPSIELQYDYDLENFRINDLNLFKVTSLSPVSFLSYAPSWKVDLGLYTAKDFGCLSCRPVYLEAGVGFSSEIWAQTLAYFLITAKSELYHQFDQGYRYGPGFEVGFLLNPHDLFKIHALYKEFIPLNRRLEGQRIQWPQLEISYFWSRNVELRGTSSLVAPQNRDDWRVYENTLGLIYFWN